MAMLVPEKAANTVFRVVDGEAVIVDTSKSLVSVINRVGTRIWNMVDGKKTVREISSAVAEAYGVDSVRVLADAYAFFADLDRKHLVVLKRASGMEIPRGPVRRRSST